MLRAQFMRLSIFSSNDRYCDNADYICFDRGVNRGPTAFADERFLSSAVAEIALNRPSSTARIARALRLLASGVGDIPHCGA